MTATGVVSVAIPYQEIWKGLHLSGVGLLHLPLVDNKTLSFTLNISEDLLLFVYLAIASIAFVMLIISCLMDVYKFSKNEYAAAVFESRVSNRIILGCCASFKKNGVYHVVAWIEELYATSKWITYSSEFLVS